MKTVSLRIEDEDLAFAKELARQRKKTQPNIVRQSLSIGLRVLAAFGGPGHGTLTPEELAEELRPYGLSINDFIARYGQRLPVTYDSKPVMERNESLYEVDPEMKDTLDLGGFAEV